MLLSFCKELKLQPRIKVEQMSGKHAKRRMAIKLASIVTGAGIAASVLTQTVLGHPLSFYVPHSHPAAHLSNQSILDAATGWKKFYEDRFDPGASQNWRLYALNPTLRYKFTQGDGVLDLNVSSNSKDGTLASFVNDSTDLPTGNFFLSVQVKNENGCQFGLVFRANLSGYYAWLYVNEIGPIFIGVDILDPQGMRQHIFHRSYDGNVDSISSLGVAQYGGSYVIEVNGTAIGKIGLSALRRYAGAFGLAGSQIGIGTCSCGSEAKYRFEDLILRTPQE